MSEEIQRIVEEKLIFNGDSLGAYLYETNQIGCAV